MRHTITAESVGERILTRNSADKPRDAFIFSLIIFIVLYLVLIGSYWFSRGHQTWYHSMC